jgi:hypothetical protein
MHQRNHRHLSRDGGDAAGVNDHHPRRTATLQGGSGSPLIDKDCRVLGVVFGNEVESPETGFALKSVEIAPQMAAIGNTKPMSTGACIS